MITKFKLVTLMIYCHDLHSLVNSKNNYNNNMYEFNRNLCVSFDDNINSQHFLDSNEYNKFNF